MDRLRGSRSRAARAGVGLVATMIVAGLALACASRVAPAPPPATPLDAEPPARLSAFADELALSVDVGPILDDASPVAEIFVFNRGSRTWQVPREPSDGLVELDLTVRDAASPQRAPPQEPDNRRSRCGDALVGGLVAVPGGARVSLGCVATRVDVHAVESLVVAASLRFRAQDGSPVVLRSVPAEVARRPLVTILARPRARAGKGAPRSVLDLLEVTIDNPSSAPLVVDPRSFRVELLGEGGLVEDSLPMFAPRVIASEPCRPGKLCAFIDSTFATRVPVYDPNDLASVLIPGRARTPLPVRGTFGPAYNGRLPRIRQSTLRAVLEVVLIGRPLTFSSGWVRLSG